MTGLIDVPEMYLRTVLELEEEGIRPLRARLVERLHVSGPSVSETVARLEHDGLLHVGADRSVELTELGRARATSVMRKHRLAELLLTEVIGLDWEQVHIEACRWEHVISDAVEARLVELLGHPTTCPHGSPIPGLSGAPAGEFPPLVTVAQAAASGVREVTLDRISEQLQGDAAVMREVREAGLMPGARLGLRVQDGRVYARTGVGETALDDDVATHLLVAAAG